MVYNILLILLTLVSIAMIASILLQRSEGGALGIGGGPSSMMSGRGAANVMTRVTTGLAITFCALALGLSLAGGTRPASSVIDRTAAPAPAGTPGSTLPTTIDLGPSIPASAAPGTATTPTVAPSLTVPAAPATSEAAPAGETEKKSN